MDSAKQVEGREKRGWVLTVIFALGALASASQFVATSAIGFLVAALGFTLCVPHAFLNPINWRDPLGLRRARLAQPKSLWRKLSALGLVLVVVGLAASPG